MSKLEGAVVSANEDCIDSVSALRSYLTVLEKAKTISVSCHAPQSHQPTQLCLLVVHIHPTTSAENRNQELGSTSAQVKSDASSSEGSVPCLDKAGASDLQPKIIDVTTLQDLAFTTPSENQTTLKDIFEAEHIQKVLFDMRNQSYLLYHFYQVKLHPVQDLQLLEITTRKGVEEEREYLRSLTKAIKLEIEIPAERKLLLAQIRNAGIRMSQYQEEEESRFIQRPLAEAIINYCLQDIQFFPTLLRTYQRRLPSGEGWEKKIEQEIGRILARIQSNTWNPVTDPTARGPWIVAPLSTDPHDGDAPGLIPQQAEDHVALANDLELSCKNEQSNDPSAGMWEVSEKDINCIPSSNRWDCHVDLKSPCLVKSLLALCTQNLLVIYSSSRELVILC